LTEINGYFGDAAIINFWCWSGGGKHPSECILWWALNNATYDFTNRGNVAAWDKQGMRVLGQSLRG